uniref:Uncharacterized protein n=2 Tax=Physcomitrium patens TaxID=3218 RepID=A0A2K1JP45_PHYPA|nr:hypothetical protein PHYPA_015702 [Physcomitrium patens]
MMLSNFNFNIVYCNIFVVFLKHKSKHYLFNKFIYLTGIEILLISVLTNLHQSLIHITYAKPFAL